MRRWLCILGVPLVCFGIQVNIFAQTFLPNSEVKNFYEPGKPTVQVMIHPMIGTDTSAVPPLDFDPHFAEYDIFVTTNSAANLSNLNPNDWSWIRRTKPGETNLVIKNSWLAKPTFVFASIGDVDNDGLPDTFELLVSKTNPLKYDSANDGVSDGEKMGSNGLPCNLEQNRQNCAVVFANANKAIQGGDFGQCTIFLPLPAPKGGEDVKFMLGGFASPSIDFTMSPVGGSWNNYFLHIPEGSRSGVVSFYPVPSQKKSKRFKDVVVTLTGSKTFRVDSHPAQIQITNSPMK